MGPGLLWRLLGASQGLRQFRVFDSLMPKGFSRSHKPSFTRRAKNLHTAVHMLAADVGSAAIVNCPRANGTCRETAA